MTFADWAMLGILAGTALAGAVLLALGLADAVKRWGGWQR
jgi:hypothetical protein